MYLRPTDLDAALSALKTRRLAVLAGGTDFFPAHVGRLLPDDILDITALASLRGVREEASSFRIGALTTWSELLATPLPACFDGLKLAAREVGGRQVQNAATLAGNLCNASPAADGLWQREPPPGPPHRRAFDGDPDPAMGRVHAVHVHQTGRPALPRDLD